MGGMRRLAERSLDLGVHASRQHLPHHDVIGPHPCTHVSPARACLATRTFSQHPSPASPPEINRTPGYPALIALVYGVAGESPALVAAVGVILSIASAALLAFVARRLFGP